MSLDTQLDLFAQPALLYVSQADAAEAMGLTTRMIQYWEAQGLLHPELPAEGRNRRYTRRDLVELRFIKSLVVDCGFSVPALKARLAGLTAPYDYDPEDVFWDLRTGTWKSRSQLAGERFQEVRSQLELRLTRLLESTAQEGAGRLSQLILDMTREGLEGRLPAERKPRRTRPARGPRRGS